MCWLDACVGCLCAPCPLAFPSHACTAAPPGPDGGAHDGPLASAAPPPCAFRRRHLRCRTRSLSAPALATAYRLRGRGLTCVVCVVSLRIQPPPPLPPSPRSGIKPRARWVGRGGFFAFSVHPPVVACILEMYTNNMGYGRADHDTGGFIHIIHRGLRHCGGLVWRRHDHQPWPKSETYLVTR